MLITFKFGPNGDSFITIKRNLQTMKLNRNISLASFVHKIPL